MELHGLDLAVIDALNATGYRVGLIGNVGFVNAIMRLLCGFEFVGDPRRPGGIVGY